MNKHLSRIALGLGLAALVAGCAAQSDEQEEPTPADAPETENTDTTSQADTLGPPAFCTRSQRGHYQYFLIGCHNGVGTSELFLCAASGADKYRWFGQPQVGYKKTTCGY